MNSTALKTATNGMIASVVWSKPSNMVQEPTMPVKLMLASHWETNALNCTLRKITNQFLNFYLFIIGLLCGEFHLLYNTQVRKKVPFFKIRCVLKIAILLQLSNASYHNYCLFIVFSFIIMTECNFKCQIALFHRFFCEKWIFATFLCRI